MPDLILPAGMTATGIVSAPPPVLAVPIDGEWAWRVLDPDGNLVRVSTERIELSLVVDTGGN